jgi:hypothetical protein
VSGDDNTKIGVPSDGTLVPKTAQSVASTDIVIPKDLTLQITTSFDSAPEWIVTKQNPIFEDEAEIRTAQRTGGMPMNKHSPFFTHPIRYLPEDAIGQKDVYRTVMIEVIPLSTSVKSILDQIRGGSLESLEVVGPIGKITNYMTARVVFNHESGAISMVNRHNKEPMQVNGTTLHVWLVPEPKYPLAADLEDEIFGPAAASRILLITDIDQDLFDLLPMKLEMFGLAGGVVEYGWTMNNLASIEFMNIKDAWKAFQALEKDAHLVAAGARFDYDIDYTCRA